MTTQMISSQLELHRLNTGRVPRLCTANRLLKQYLFRYNFVYQYTKEPLLYCHNFSSCCSNYISRSFNARYQGHISAALVLGGVDVTGPHLYSIYPHGSTDSLPYVTMGMYIHYDSEVNKSIITGNYTSCGSVMFSQASVSHSVHKRRGSISGTRSLLGRVYLVPGPFLGGWVCSGGTHPPATDT